MTDPVLKGLVLAGGESRRMGRDKALLDRGGETQLAYAFRVLSAATSECFVSARAEPPATDERARFPLVLDRDPGLGPVAGILAAFEHDPAAAWLVLACDLPNVTAETLDCLVAQRDPARPFTAFRSVHNGLPEPLCAIYEPAARDIVADFAARDIRCPRKIMLNADTLLIEQPASDALDNLNTPDDLARSKLTINA